VWNVELPAPTERETIFSIQLARVGRDPRKYDLKKLASTTPDFSGAEVKKLVKAALSRAFADNRREVTTDDLLHVIGEFTPLSKTMADDINKRRERLKGVAKPANGSAVNASPKEIKRKIAAFAG
jgi:ATP-dependent 26S proteasome regulatory subunit